MRIKTVGRSPSREHGDLIAHSGAQGLARAAGCNQGCAWFLVWHNPPLPVDGNTEAAGAEIILS